MSDDEYVEELRIVRRKKGTVRSKSSKSDQYESDLLRDLNTRDLAGPTESRPVDEEQLRRRYQDDPVNNEGSDWSPAPVPERELTPGQRAISDALMKLGATLIEDLVVPLLRDVAWPTFKEKLQARAERRRIGASKSEQTQAKVVGERSVQSAIPDQNEPEGTATDPAVAEHSVRIRRSTLAVAQIQLKLADEYAAQLRWFISHAEVLEDDSLPPELERSVSLMLEGRTDELDDEERQAVARFIRDHETAVTLDELRVQRQIAR